MNSLRLKLARFLSLHKSLPCFDACNILSKKQKEAPSFQPLSIVHPKQVWILFGELCNIACIMCDQDHKSRTILDNNVLKENIDWVLVEDIEFQGGEVLAMKSAKEMYLSVTQEMNKKVNMITNGILITEEWAEHLVKGSDCIQISVNAATKEVHELVNRGSNYERV